MSESVSVVVTSLNSGGLLEECLVALERQTADEGFEVIVVDSSDDGSGELVRQRFPRARLLSIPYPGSRALMRAHGVRHAQGEIVALTEDHCVPREDWVARMIESHRSAILAVGGPVENSAKDSASLWAIYFSEYYRFMAPVADGPVTDIPGSNASYKRSALLQTDLQGIGLWDSLINAQMAGNGNEGKIVSDSEMVIYHNKREKPLRFLGQRHNYSRCFAGLRAKRVSIARRLFYLAFSPTLPVLVLWRTFRDVWKKGRNRSKLVCSLPFLVPILVVSAYGEFLGYLLGVGDSWRKLD